MASNTPIVWKLLYWTVVVCGILLLLASLLPGVSGNATTTAHPSTIPTTAPLSVPVSDPSGASATSSGPESSPVPNYSPGTSDSPGPNDSPRPSEGPGPTTSSRGVLNGASTGDTKTSKGSSGAGGMAMPMTTAAPPGKGSSAAVIAAVVVILILAIVTVVLVVWFCKYRNQPCCKGHRVRAKQGSKHESFTSDGGINGFGMSPVQAEMQPFIMRHRCDIFIHHHGTDLTLAEMMRSKLLDQESHLHITLWSEIAGTGRESRPSTKRLALSLVHSTTVVLLVSWKYLQHESQRFRLALSRIPRKVDSVRGKVVIVRRIEEDKVPADLKTDIAHSLEYNVDTDSKFFWPRFNRAVIPQRDDMLYWRT